ncbi:MAG: hypothetical protein HQL36_01920 [Alphaproteobacteria bacterium]|nr:hypothetical protein [Alphaproteobacteria bacterium]
MTSTFHNYPDTALVDAIGDLDGEIKALQDRMKDAKEEFTRRGLDKALGERFSVCRSESVSWRLDTKAVKTAMGEDWCTAHSKPSLSARFTITVNKAALSRAA